MNVSVYHFSPAGTTKRIATALGRALDPHARIIGLADATILSGGVIPEAADEDDQGDALAVFAVPVFAGRVPQPAAEAIARIGGKGIQAVSVAVYGNRDFDDALVELNDLLERQGFSVLASGAFVARHSMLPSVAAGRPDADDIAEVEKFARRIAEKIAALSTAGTGRPASPAVPGNRPYKEAPAAAWAPVVSEACTLCGICAARCPAEAIPHNAPNTTGPACFQCMRCVEVCPEGARSLPEPVAAMIAEKLAPLADRRTANQTWL